METIEQQKQDVLKFPALLIERGIPIPGNIAGHYIKRATGTDPDEVEALPFD